MGRPCDRILERHSMAANPSRIGHGISLATQARALNTLDNWSATSDGRRLVATGAVRPSALSREYRLRVEYVRGRQPKTWLVEPKMQRFEGKLPEHIYSDGSLCLYRPRYNEWTPSDFISTHIVPWISEWLLHYEAWLVSGEWYGGGEHPVKVASLVVRDDPVFSLRRGRRRRRR